MRADLHTHSTASDGRSTPTELVAEARAAGLDAVALTDHDTFAGLAAARAAAAGTGLRVLAGAEISTRHDGMSVHLLGYGELGADPALSALTARTVASRDDRARAMAVRVAEGEGLDTAALLAALAAATPPGATPGRPHLADALIALGAVRDRDEAFLRLLADPGPYHVAHWAPATTEAVAAVAAAGGLAVLAHPRSAHGPRRLSDADVAEITAAGLAGLEVDHRDHDARAREHLRGLARRHGLLATGSSDYHGTGKQNRLGEHTTAPEVVAEMDGRLGGRW